MSGVAEPPAPLRTAPNGTLPVEVVRSSRRRKTVQARLVDGRLRILLPAHLSAADEEHWVREMSRRFERRSRSGQIDVSRRARHLARQFGLPEPAGIRWVSNQSTRWGSCTPATGQIRLSDRLSGFPGWVIDYVIVHELAHLEVLDHGPAFRALEGRYPKAERAIGYLLAKGLDPHEEGRPRGSGAADAGGVGGDLAADEATDGWVPYPG